MTISEDLQGRGLRATPFREELLSLLRAEGLPLSHQEIQGRFREKVDRVTLYRNLELLRTHGLVHQVQGLDGAWRFCAHDVSGPVEIRAVEAASVTAIGVKAGIAGLCHFPFVGAGGAGKDLPKDEILRMVKELESQMKAAAKALEFEKAAALRDEVVELRRRLVGSDDEELSAFASVASKPGPVRYGRSQAGGRDRSRRYRR